MGNCFPKRWKKKKKDDVISTRTIGRHLVERVIMSFPRDVLRHMKANAKPLMAVKLMKCCKYFQHQRFPYVVLESIHTNSEKNWNYAQVGSTCNHITGSLDIFPQNNLWIKGYLAVVQRNDVNTLLRKIIVCQLTYLSLENQSLTINEFEVLSTTVYTIKLSRTIIADKNDQMVAMEQILQCLPNALDIVFVHTIPPIISLEDAINIALPKLLVFELLGMYEAINFDTFSIFMKAHPVVHYRIEYSFFTFLPPEHMRHLQLYVDMIVKENSIEYPPPLIYFPGQIHRHYLDLLNVRYCKHKLSQVHQIDIL